MPIELLDPTETSTVLAGVHNGRSNALLNQISDSLMSVVDSESSVWVTGLIESTINSLRTRMYRKDVQITVRKAKRGTEKGHVITARTIQEGER